MSDNAAALWTAPELLAAVPGSLAVSPKAPFPVALSGISIDSRTLQQGDLFVALSGPSFDGNDFVAAAFEAGAAAAIATRADPGISAPLLLVPDTLRAMEQMGIARRRIAQAKIAAITGSVGKTSSKEMLAAVLGASGPTHASVGSFNNHWGVPLSLARLPREVSFGIFELGMNHAGEIANLTCQVQPDIAIITTIAPAHLEFFASIEAIADAKAEIFLGMQPGASVLLNSDNDQFDRLSQAARKQDLRILAFGTKAEAEARLLSVTPQQEGSLVEASIQGRHLSYFLPLAGQHMAMNSVAVLGVAQVLDADLDAGVDALCRLQPLGGRGKRAAFQVRDGEAVLIDESYNASPAAMQAALQVLGFSPTGARRIAVLGDMRELGSEGARLHAALAESVVAAAIDRVYTVGPLMENLSRALDPMRRAAHAETASALLPILAQDLAAEDLVMVKGSLGTRMADIVKPLLAGFAGLRSSGLRASGLRSSGPLSSDDIPRRN